MIGLLFIYCIWVPLAMLGNWIAQHALDAAFGNLPADEIARRLSAGGSSSRFSLWLASIAAPILTYSFACWSAGALVGRFGGKAGPKEAVTAGALSALVGCVLSLIGASTASSLAALLVLLPLGIAAAWVGARFGMKRRVASATRVPPPPPSQSV
jgi:tRNA-(ms[2]io[6]A)-hydroxylase